MKTVTNHLSEIILAVAAVALIVGVVLTFGGTVGGFFESTTDKLGEVGNGDIWNLGQYGESDGSDNEEDLTVLEGGGQSFHKLAPTALTFRSVAPLSEFQEVQINGETVDASNYTLTEGSTVVTLSIDYLKTLDAGEYEVAVVSNSGAPSASFEVIEPELNEHGFYYNQPYTAYVDYFGATTVFFLREDGTVDVIMLEASYTETCTYTVEGDSLTITAEGGIFTATANDDGIYCNELVTTFVLGDESIVADDDYLYVLDNSGNAYYVASVINKTKSSYGTIRTGINDKPTECINNYAFADCTNLVCITIPECIEYVLDYAFSGCTSLEKVVFENCEVYLWGNNIFLDAPLTQGCTKKHTDKDQNNFCDRCNYCEHLNTELQNVTDEYTGDVVCLDCNITVTKGNYTVGLFDAYGNNVASWSTLVNDYGMDVTLAYSGSSLASNYYKTATTSPYYVLTNNAELSSGAKLIIDDSVKAIGQYAFYNLDSLITVTFSENSQLTFIGTNAFSGCSSLIGFELPASVTTIGTGAFHNCPALLEVYNKSSLTITAGSKKHGEIGYYAKQIITSDAQTNFQVSNGFIFYDDGTYSSLVKYLGSDMYVELPVYENVAEYSIHNSAFKGLSKLESIVIPACVTSISTGAFSYCTSLESVTFAANSQLTVIDSSAFYNCKSLVNIEIPANVTSIGMCAFWGCTSLTSIELPASVTVIGIQAFANCGSLESIVIPASVETIGESAFLGSASLTNITVDEGNTVYQSIDGNLYSKDGKTLIQYAVGKTDTTFEVPSSVTSIDVYAFNDCTSLESIVIPDSVKAIGQYAFTCCTSLTNITFEGTIAQWNAITLASSWNDSVPATEVICSDGTVAL